MYFPSEPVACYVAAWQLPRLDSHQQADDSFQDTPSDGWAIGQYMKSGIYWQKAFIFAATSIPEYQDL